MWICGVCVGAGWLCYLQENEGRVGNTKCLDYLWSSLTKRFLTMVILHEQKMLFVLCQLIMCYRQIPESISFFPASRSCQPSLACNPGLHLQCNHPTSAFIVPSLFSVFNLHSFYKDPSDHIEPTRIIFSFISFF